MNLSKPSSAKLVHYSLVIWLVIAAFLLFSNVMRSLFLWNYADPGHAIHSEIMRSFSVGSRFDLKAIAYLLLVPYLLGCIIQTRFKALCRWLILGSVGCGVLLTIVNYYYYSAFGNNFDELFFGFEGMANALWVSIWHDYPVIKISLLVLLTLFLFDRFIQLLLEKITLPKLSRAVSFIIILMSAVLYLIALRIPFLNIFEFPRDKAEFSQHQAINSASYNGILAFSDLMAEKFKQYPKVTLNDGMQYYNSLFDTKISLNQFSLQSLFTHTKKNEFIEKNPPNVVFVQLEGMGRRIALYDDEKRNNLWGNLRPYLKKDFLFQHFISEYNSSILTLSRFTFNSAMTDLFSSDLTRGDYASFVTRPFKEAGYTTIFLTTYTLNWFRAGVVLRKHGFDTTVGKSDIMRDMPASESAPWGLYDEYAYHYALDLMQKAKASGKPIFIYISMGSNHEPYSVPKHYQASPIQVPLDFAEHMKIPTTKLRAMLTSYQYSNNALGNFIKQIEEGEFKDNTIIAATGDHNQHELIAKDTDTRDSALRYGVYFYLHVPTQYLNNQHLDTATIGSHKDIFPTLYNLSLSDALYPALGNNLADSSSLVFATNSKVIMLPEGVIVLTGGSRFYPWLNKNKIFLENNSRRLSNAQQEMVTRVKAYNALMQWQILYEWEA